MINSLTTIRIVPCVGNAPLDAMLDDYAYSVAWLRQSIHVSTSIMANMSSIRFFSLEPLQLDLIANEEDSSDGSLQCLSKRLAQMHELDFTNQFCTAPAKQSSILEQVDQRGNLNSNL